LEYEILVINALPRELAAIRERVSLPELSETFPRLLNEVWQLLNESKVHSTGHNVTLYESAEHDASGVLVFEAWFGVEVHEALPDSNRVRSAQTPGGAVACTMHLGTYDGVAEAHEALQRWCEANNRPITGKSWEVYGAWSDEASKLRTDVFYELA
jgi:effector-binding domain-containing protein